MGAFAALCIIVLTAAPFLVEPDDYAYRASIVAITQGHFLTLTTAQVHTLGAQLAGGHWSQPGSAPAADRPVGPASRGRWISEKDPGYPFLAAPFEALGVIRLAPLFYGALVCLGLFFGARRWLAGSAGPRRWACSGGGDRGLAAADAPAGLALAASWCAVWGLYAAYDWMANPGLTTLQSARFYVPALGAIALLGAWLVVRVPPRAVLSAPTPAAVAAALFGWAGGPSPTCGTTRSSARGRWAGRMAGSCAWVCRTPYRAGEHRGTAQRH